MHEASSSYCSVFYAFHGSSLAGRVKWGVGGGGGGRDEKCGSRGEWYRWRMRDGRSVG